MKHKLFPYGDAYTREGELKIDLALADRPDRALMVVRFDEGDRRRMGFAAFNNTVADPQRVFDYLDHYDNEERLYAFAEGLLDGKASASTFLQGPPDVFSEQRWGYVYLMGPDPDLVKIGFAADPRKRLRALQTGHPEPLTIFAALPGTMDDERELHELFSHAKTVGEWFDISGDEVLQGVVRDACEAHQLMRSWRRFSPIPGSARDDESITGLKERLGANYTLAVKLHKDHGDGDLEELLSGLVFNERSISPNGEAMEYGIRAAARKRVARAAYVLGCAENGINDNKVPNC